MPQSGGPKHPDQQPPVTSVRIFNGRCAVTLAETDSSQLYNTRETVTLTFAVFSRILADGSPSKMVMETMMTMKRMMMTMIDEDDEDVVVRVYK